MQPTKRNKIEKLKLKLSPVDYFERLARLDPEHLDEADRFYLKNFGIYNHKLAPGRFTLRIRVTAGRLAVSALRNLHEAVTGLGASMLITSRAQLEVHDLDYTEAVALSRRVEAWGLTSWQTNTDNFRNITTHPLDGLALGCEVEVFGLIERMESIFLKNPRWVGMLPRKFNTYISGCREQLVSPFGNDLAFVLAKKEGVWGFNLHVGGKNSETARPLDLFVTPEEAVAAFAAVAEIYLEEGPRESRSRARLRHLLETWGTARFREAFLARFGEAREAGEPAVAKAAPFVETPLEEGSVAVRYTSRFGEMEAGMWEEVLQVCETRGIEEVRLGSDKNLYIPHLPAGTRFRFDRPHYGGYVTCVGSRRCVYSLLETVEASEKMGLARCGELGVTLGMSGCLKGCARHAFCDIGLVGIRTKLFAREVERGVRLYLGAAYTRGERAGRLILYSVPMRCLDGMIDVILDLFEASGYDDFETFAKETIDHYSEPALAFWLLLNYYRREVLGEGALLLPPPGGVADEKAFFAEALEGDGRPEDREIAEYLRLQEAFAFREAIIFLERASFAVK
ncbi:hypothetical protein [Hydrogenimonas sp.]